MSRIQLESFLSRVEQIVLQKHIVFLLTMEKTDQNQDEDFHIWPLAFLTEGPNISTCNVKNAALISFLLLNLNFKLTLCGTYILPG